MQALKKGDKVNIINKYSPYYNQSGTVEREDNFWPFYIDVMLDNGHIASFALIDLELVQSAINSYAPSPTNNPCTCDTFDLCCFGCKCGAIEKERQAAKN